MGSLPGVLRTSRVRVHLLAAVEARPTHPSHQRRVSPACFRRDNPQSRYLHPCLLLALTSLHRSPTKGHRSRDDEAHSEPHLGTPAATPPPASPSKLSRRRSRSLSRSRSASLTGSTTIFGRAVDWISGATSSAMMGTGSKMKDFTHFFHKHPAVEDGGKADLLPPTTPSKTPSKPPKRVEFWLEEYGPPKTSSSPIDIPKFAAPSLPPLRLPTAAIMDHLGHTDNDPIPTARPEDTPVLTALIKDDYFSPLPTRESSLAEQGLLPTSSKEHVDERTKNPFTDAVSVSEPEHPPMPGLTHSSTSESEDSAPTSNTHSDEHSIVHGAKLEDASAMASNINTCTTAKDPFSDNAESDIFSQRELPKDATHEDIRHRFQTRTSQGMSDGWNSPASDSSDPQTPREICDVSFRPSQESQQAQSLRSRTPMTSTDDSEVSAVRKNLEAMSLTDPVKVSFDRNLCRVC